MAKMNDTLDETEATAGLTCIVILRRAGKVAFLLRKNTSWMNDHYGLIGGRVEPGEMFTAAAVREAKEEVGVEIAPEDLKAVLTVELPESKEFPTQEVFMVFEATQWRGEPYNAEPDVHAELAWFDPHNLPTNIVPVVQPALKAIEAGQTLLEYSANLG